MLNALTVDVEEYFQVSLFERHAPAERWDELPRRAADSVRVLLELFAAKGVHATFFSLGWIAEREKSLMREIVANGHELASHGYSHRQITDLSPETFRADLRRSRSALQEASGVKVEGFRAPSWSIGPSTEWALDVLAEEGYRYDSSIFPIRHDRYGWLERPREPHFIHRAAGTLIEAPPATARLFGHNLPVAGGGYLRHFPPQVIQWGIRRMNEVDRIPAVVYLHPWEIDPGQPRLDVPALTRIRHYRNLEKVLPRLTSLLDQFEFGTIKGMLDCFPAREIAHREDSLPVAPASVSP